MNEKRYYEIFGDLLTTILKCGWLDIRKLAELIDWAEKLGSSFDDIVDEAEDIGGIDVNSLIYIAMRHINEAVYEQVKLEFKAMLDEGEISEWEYEDLCEIAEQRIEDFSPYVNYLDSHFENELDSYDDPEDIAKEILEEYREEA